MAKRSRSLSAAEVAAWVVDSMPSMLTAQQLKEWRTPVSGHIAYPPNSQVLGLVLSGIADERTLLTAFTVSKSWQLAISDPQYGLQQRLAATRAACEARRRFHPPFFVDLVDGSDAGPVGPGSGTQHLPVATVARARELYYQFKQRWAFGSSWQDDRVHIKVVCQLGLCPLLQCRMAGCMRMVCQEHGEYGVAWVHEDAMEPVFTQVTVCAEEGCDVAYCEQHAFSRYYDDNLHQCQPCHDRDYAARSLGATNEMGEPTYLCDQHARVCDEELEDDGYGDDDEPRICNMVCCSNCIDDHKCGDDVTDYL